MVFGDGDGRLFNRFTIALDVIGHELTHGVTSREAGLVYRGQPGEPMPDARSYRLTIADDAGAREIACADPLAARGPSPS